MGRPGSMQLLPLLLLSLAALSPAAPACPQLPAGCVCEAAGRISVSCVGVDAKQVVKVLTVPLDRMRLENVTIPVLNALPKGPIRSLELVNCSIASVDPKVFASLSSLEELHLQNNKLSLVPLFGKLPNLVSLNLNDNKIASLPDGALAGLSELRHLRLEANAICELDSSALNETKTTLELLDLSGNCLSAVPAQALRNHVRLMYLDLSDNKIGEVGKFALMNLPQLKELRLNNNLVNKIDPMSFMNVPQLQYLYMRNNLIGNLDGSRLQAFKQLEILDVTNNMLLKLPSFKELVSLKQVRLDGNLISKIDTLAFSNNPKLQLISIQDNNVAQISRNSFDSLDQLVVLLLSNNSITTIEKGMFDGMKNLQQLNLRNNSIVEIDKATFSSLPHLTTIDLSYNQIKTIGKSAFSQQEKLFWLDLSNNKLTGFERGTFEKKIANVLLDGNRLLCDESIDWFVQWLVFNRVRTFLPFQKEIVCNGPAKHTGVKLKDLMMKKANETLSSGMQQLGLADSGNAAATNGLLSSLLPGLTNLGGMAQGGMAASPFLAAITQAIPALRSMPGMRNLNNGLPGGENAELNNAFEQFTGPIVRFATGGQPVASDIAQLVQSIPSLVVNVPGYGNIDISKLNPDLIQHVLKGGQIPGIPKETLDKIVATYMKKMSNAAKAAQEGRVLDANEQKLLPPLDKLPQEFVTSVIQGEALPGLDPNQTQVIKEYYTQRLPTMLEGGDSAVLAGLAGVGGAPGGGAMDMLALLPPGYNISKIPAEVIMAASRGEIPNLNLLPQDLQDYLKANSDKLLSHFSRSQSPAKPIDLEDLLSKLPKFDRPQLETFSPYDLNSLSVELKHEEEELARAQRMRLFTGIALGLVGAITLIVVAVMCVQMRKARGGGFGEPRFSSTRHSPGMRAHVHEQ